MENEVNIYIKRLCWSKLMRDSEPNPKEYNLFFSSVKYVSGKFTGPYRVRWDLGESGSGCVGSASGKAGRAQGGL